MNCYTHDEHVHDIVNHFKKKGIHCITEVSLGNRRIDIECENAHIEVKNTCEDYHSTRSKEQISDMKEYSCMLNKPFVVSTPCGCFEAKNTQGKEFIKKHDLIECPTKQELHCCTKHEID